MAGGRWLVGCGLWLVVCGLWLVACGLFLVATAHAMPPLSCVTYFMAHKYRKVVQRKCAETKRVRKQKRAKTKKGATKPHKLWKGAWSYSNRFANPARLSFVTGGKQRGVVESFCDLFSVVFFVFFDFR